MGRSATGKIKDYEQIMAFCNVSRPVLYVALLLSNCRFRTPSHTGG